MTLPCAQRMPSPFDDARTDCHSDTVDLTTTISETIKSSNCKDEIVENVATAPAMGENDRVLAYKIAREHFENNNDHAAVAIFESCQRSSCKHPIQEEELEALSVTADLALCRFRAAAKSTETNAKFLMDVSYHEAICANNHLRTRLRQCHDHARLELCLLAAISAVWIHTKMDNLRMARHIVWDTLQWAASNLQPADTAQLCCLSESLVLLSQSVHHQVLRKFRHVLDVLDLVQGKDLSLLIGKKCSVGHIHDKVAQQERAVMMLARRRLGLLTACSAGAYNNKNNLDIACKLQQILRAIDEPHAHTDEDIAELRATIDHVKSSDLNLLGHFQSDCQLALTTYTRALKCLQPSEVTLECEIAFNIADCLSRLGFHNQAKALFLWLYEREDRAASTNVIAISPKGPPVEPKELLWKAFVSATLDNDVVSTLAIADSLHSKGPSKASELALAFSLHQAGRPSQTKRNFTNESQMYWAFERDQQLDITTDKLSSWQRSICNKRHTLHTLPGNLHSIMPTASMKNTMHESSRRKRLSWLKRGLQQLKLKR